jgi:hypothetical protein
MCTSLNLYMCAKPDRNVGDQWVIMSGKKTEPDPGLRTDRGCVEPLTRTECVHLVLLMGLMTLIVPFF